MAAAPSPEETKTAATQIAALQSELEGVLFGQEKLISLTIAGLLSRGHLLLEGLPGLGKTELVKSLSAAIGLEAKRVQFTPDLLPGDITGNPLLQEVDGTRQFVFQRGPVFANLVLADEINRASPKTQSALLEAMQERSVTVMGETHQLPSPFFVLATQNPIELEGTYPLPEAQLDRFLFKLEVRQNPVAVLEKIVASREIGVAPTVKQVMTAADLSNLADMTRRVHLAEVVANYIARLVFATHAGNSTASDGVRFGASPRAALALAAASKARALAAGRPHAGFEDVQEVAPAVLGHRIVLDYSARIAGRSSLDVVAALLEEVPAQRREIPQTLQSIKVQ